MAFLEVEFPREISYGSSGGPGFNTSIVEGDSGYSERVSRWSTPRHRYNVRYGIRTVTQLNTIKDLYIRASGTVHGFRYYDWLDHSTATDHVSAPGPFDVIIGTSTGTGTQTFQLKKQYTYGGLSPVERTIRKPISGTVRVAINGVEVNSGWVVDTTTGVVTISSGLTNGVNVSAGCEFNVPVQFGQEIDELLSATIDNFNSGDLPDLPLVEMIGDVVSPERFYAGGGSVVLTVQDFVINHSLKKVIVYSPANANAPVTAYLIDPSDLELGGPYFHIIYRPVIGTSPLTIKSSDGSVTYATLDAAGECSILYVFQESGVNKWVLFNNF